MTAIELKYELFRNYANEETIEAVEESMRGEYAGVADCSSFESFKKSLGIGINSLVKKENNCFSPSRKATSPAGFFSPFFRYGLSRNVN